MAWIEVELSQNRPGKGRSPFASDQRLLAILRHLHPPSVIVLERQVQNLAILELECQAPVAVDVQRKLALAPALQGMEVAYALKILEVRHGIEQVEQLRGLCLELKADTSGAAVLEQFSQALVFEAD